MEPETIEKVPVERLQLDRQNPRLIGGAEDSSDEAIVARLYTSSALGELLQSISTNGYLDIEPLIVTTSSEGDELVVLEGNRRLAALRVLREPGLVDRIAASEGLRITVPPMEDTLRETMDRVSVYPVANREQARSFIGFKHINGPARWDAYAKARFAAAWYENERSQGIDLKDIANAIGDKHDTIKRMVSAVYVLDQAEHEGLYSLEDRYSTRFNFSHLYVALSRSQYMEYLGLGTGWARLDPEPNQVSREKFEELRKVLVWIHGSKEDDSPPLIRSQNPDIKKLGEVLAHAEGRHILEATGDLEAAHASTEPVDRQFTAFLIRARDEIRDAAGSLRAYDGRDQSLLDIAEDIKETSATVYERMARKRREAGADE